MDESNVAIENLFSKIQGSFPATLPADGWYLVTVSDHRPAGKDMNPIAGADMRSRSLPWSPVGGPNPS